MDHDEGSIVMMRIVMGENSDERDEDKNDAKASTMAAKNLKMRLIFDGGEREDAAARKVGKSPSADAERSEKKVVRKEGRSWGVM